MKHAFLTAAFAAMAVAGCNPTSPEPQSTGAAIVETVTINGTKGLILAELAYNSANAMAQAAVRAGAIKGADASRARDINAKVTAALITAKGAQNAVLQAREVSKAWDGIIELRELTQ